MPRRKNEPVAIMPEGVFRVVLHELRPERICHGRIAHRHARMSRVRLLDGIGREHPYRVDREFVNVGLSSPRRLQFLIQSADFIVDISPLRQIIVTQLKGSFPRPCMDDISTAGERYVSSYRTLNRVCRSMISETSILYGFLVFRPWERNRPLSDTLQK